MPRKRSPSSWPQAEKLTDRERWSLYTVEGHPGVYRRTSQPLSEEAHAGAVIAQWPGQVQPSVFVRDERIERLVAGAMGAELVSSLDRYVCDCGEKTPLVSVTPEGLECPRCAKENGRSPG